MKVEAICINDHCPTIDSITKRKSVQLLQAGRLGISGMTALDEEGEMLSCPWCFAPVIVRNPSREEAQFPLGKVRISEGARQVLNFGFDDDLAWVTEAQTYVTRHQSGDHGSYPGSEVDQYASGSGQNIGRVISHYNHLGSPLWIITERDRHLTRVLLPEEFQEVN